MQRILFTGSRDMVDPDPIRVALSELPEWVNALKATWVTGHARGLDYLAAEMGRRLCVNVEEHLAERWGKWPECGPKRNSHMVSLGADLCLAFPGPVSRGTWDCLQKAARAGIPTRIYPVEL